MTPETLDADATSLAGAGSVAEEALALHRDALAVLNEGWRSQSSCAATELIDRQCGEAADLVDALHSAAAELRLLRDALADPGTGAGFAPHDVAAARLEDRPAPQFQTPAAAPQQAPAWPAGISLPALPPLPNLGAALLGMATQIADAIGPVAADLAAPDAAHEPPPAPEPRPVPEPRLAPDARPVHHPHAAPAAETIRPATEILAKPVAEPAPAPLPPPLLAAEQPPVVVAPPPPPAEQPPAEPTADVAGDPAPPAPPRSPCEIAADELPHVG